MIWDNGVSSEHQLTSYLGSDIDNESVLELLSKRVQSDEIDYRVIPEDPARRRFAGAETRAWRVVLVPEDGGQPRPYEIRGDAVLGSHLGEDNPPDIDVTDWQGYEHGVSRRHLMLRPGTHKLFIMDLRSTNGTHINGLPLGVGWAYALHSGDLITAGTLHMRIQIVEQP